LLAIVRIFFLTQIDSDSIAHIPNINIFEDFENLIMLLNYSELVLVVTPARYNSPCLLSFQQPLYALPRKRGREIRRWLLDYFELHLEPPASDGCDDTTRLESLMLQSLVKQAHTLWESVRHRDELGVLGPTCLQKSEEREIGADQVLQAIRSDLSSFSGFRVAWEQEIKQSAPTSYAWPACPSSSRYVLVRKC
jgi:hypothetical protein